MSDKICLHSFTIQVQIPLQISGKLHENRLSMFKTWCKSCNKMCIILVCVLAQNPWLHNQDKNKRSYFLSTKNIISCILIKENLYNDFPLTMLQTTRRLWSCELCLQPCSRLHFYAFYAKAILLCTSITYAKISDQIDGKQGRSRFQLVSILVYYGVKLLCEIDMSVRPHDNLPTNKQSCIHASFLMSETPL